MMADLFLLEYIRGKLKKQKAPAERFNGSDRGR
jgi:hypothetical protein